MFKRCTNLKISSKGISTFKEKTGLEIKERVEYERRKIFRRICVNDAISMMKGADFLIDESEKPSLFDVFRVSLSSPYKNVFRDRSIFNFDLDFRQAIALRLNYAIENGVFYSAKEVREVLQYFFGENEILKLSRFIGIIFYKKRLSFIYSISNKRIEWVFNNEQRVIKSVSLYLKCSDLLSNYVNEIMPSCIIFGKNYYTLPKIMFDNSTYSKKLNIQKLNSVFYNAYYIPVSQYSIEQFKTDARSTKYIRSLESEAFAKYFMNGTLSVSQMYFIYNRYTDNTNFVVLPFIDLCELNNYLSENKKLTVYIYDKHLANPISSLLRENVVTIKRITLENPFTIEDVNYKTYTT